MGEQKNKRQRFSQNGEGSGGKKSSVAALACSPAATVAQAMAKPAATVAETTPLAVMSPAPASPTVVDLAAPSSAAVATQDATVEDLVVTIPVAAMAPAPAAPSPVAIAKPVRVVKPEEQGAEVAEQEHGAMVEEEEEPVSLELPKKLFHCAACPGPLRPPVFKCENEHFVCYACGVDGDGGDANKHCVPCGRDVNYTRSGFMDGVVDAYKVACPYKRFGCPTSMAYHSAADHAASCRHAPCYCFDCRFDGSPASLVRHLTARSGQHSWPVEKIQYEVAKPFVVPASSEVQRRLLVADDNCVFLLAVGAGRDPGGRRPVNVVCVRGNARPLYTGVLWVDGPPAAPGQPLTSSFQLKATVASCSVPGEVDMEQGWLHAHVNPNMLHGESSELHLRLCLTKFPWN